MAAKDKVLFKARYGAPVLALVEDRIMQALEGAVRDAGSPHGLVDRMNAYLLPAGQPRVTRQNLVYWRKTGTFLDQDLWPAFEAATDMLVTRRTLRPDIYEYGMPKPGEGR